MTYLGLSRALPSVATALAGWRRNRRRLYEGVSTDMVRRSQGRQEYRMAWWRLLLALVPMAESIADTSHESGAFSYAIIVYALVVLLIVSNRRHPGFWRWVFTIGDVALLQTYALLHLGERPPEAAAFSYVAAAIIIMLTNSLRLSLPLLWLSTAGIMAGFYGLFGNTLEVRGGVGGTMLILIGLSLATMVVQGQLRLLSESRSRARLRRFVSPEIADELERRLDIFDNPATREVTVLFVDIRGFTPSAESMSAESAVAFLNQFFERVTKAVFAHQGTIDKYIGDCVMVLFGAPLQQADDATRAVKAAMEIVRSIAAWNAERAANNEPPVIIGIGLNTSRVVAGAIGTPQKLEYTVIGDGVNVAARVCELTKSKPAPILVTQSTREKVPDDLPWIDFGEVAPRGRNNSLRLFGLRA